MDEILKQRFWVLLHAAINAPRQPKVAMLTSNEARVTFDDHRLLVILLDERPKERVALENWVKVLLEESTAKEIDIVVLGETSEIDRTLIEGDFQAPWPTRLAILTLNEDGACHEITQQKSDKFARSLIEASLSTSRSEANLERVKNDIKIFIRQEQEQIGEVMSFQRKLMSQDSGATYILLALIGAFYLAQLQTGGPDTVDSLVQMGANSRILIGEGEYWRLITSIFLHGGTLHVLANSYVLFALGTFFNKLIGNARFITLFLVSGIAGSVASVVIGGSMLSVGASGGLWGLFGLSGALILRPSSFLPDSIRKSMRRVTVINLVLNLGISFLPMVDIYAHLGGGLAGLLLGLFYIHQEDSRPQNNRFHVATAVFLSLLTAASIAVNLYTQQPWQLIQSGK